MSTFVRYMILGICCFIAACNYTEGPCVPRGEEGSWGGVGAGPIVPSQGGFGETSPEPQAEDDEESADACNASEGQGRTFTCIGDVVCYKPNAGGGQSTTGCHFAVKRFVSTSADKLVEDLRKKCQEENPGFSCLSDELTCSDTPAQRYGCSGGITCVDDNGHQSGCVVGGEPGDPYSSLGGNVYAFDEPDARNHLADLCETLKHDKYGDNCAHGGMCCIPSSVTCHKSP